MTDAESVVISNSTRNSTTGSHGQSVLPISFVSEIQIGRSANVSQVFTEFHMTVQSKITDLSVKQASMLLSVCNVRAVNQGVDFQLYLVMEFLYSYLWKSGHDPMETATENVRKTLLLSDVIFSYIRGKWLEFSDTEKLPDDVVEKIKTLGWLPTERTYGSWKPYWQVEKFIRIRTVPVDAIRRRDKYATTEKYSGYTRGYGNDGSPANPGRTKPSVELDGDPVSDNDQAEVSRLLLEYEDYQTAINLIENAKAHRKQKH